jgi:hypothetical protein
MHVHPHGTSEWFFGSRRSPVSVVQNGTSADALTGVRWQKSRRSGATGNCVEVTPLPDGDIAVRNSRFPGGPALVYTRAEIEAFFLGVKDGEFDDVIR